MIGPLEIGANVVTSVAIFLGGPQYQGEPLPITHADLKTMLWIVPAGEVAINAVVSWMSWCRQ